MKWVLGICASILVFMVVTTITRFEEHNRRINANEIALGRLTDGMLNLTEVTKSIRTEQMERLIRLGEMSVKVGTMDQRAQFIDDRYKVILDELNTVRQRLEVLHDRSQP